MLNELVYSFRSSRSHKNPSLISSSLDLFRIYWMKESVGCILVGFAGIAISIDFVLFSMNKDYSKARY